MHCKPIHSASRLASRHLASRREVTIRTCRRSAGPSTAPAVAVAVGLSLSLVAASAFAAAPPRVHVIDSNPAQGNPLSTQPVNGAYWAGALYLRASLDEGNELYVSDGTTLGTTLLADLVPGADSSSPNQITRVGAEESAGARIFFTAETADHGTELWISDGTTEGTELAEDFEPGPGDGDPSSLVAWGGDLYLSASSGGVRNLYWVDRATTTATLLGGGSFEMEAGVEMLSPAGALYFPALAAGTGQVEIWSTDGSTVTEETNAQCDSIGDLLAAGGGVVFVCVRAASIDILQLDDGETDGYVTIHSHAGATSVTSLVVAGGLLYWKLDGSNVWAYDQGPPASLVSAVTTYGAGGYVGSMVRLGSLLIFNADSGDGIEPHVADGFTDSQIQDIHPTAGGAQFADFVVHGDYAYFTADDGSTGYELWRTDGTAGGTTRPFDLVADEGSSFPTGLHSTPMGLFFSISGGGLWLTDGVAAARVDALQGSNIAIQETFYDELGERLFYTAVWDDVGHEPWVSDGTEEGTFRLRDIRPGLSSSAGHEFLAAFPLTARGVTATHVIFSADDGVDDEQLWHSDGTEPGTQFFALINPDNDALVRPGAPFGGMYYFSADDGSTDHELWRTDGTPGGTERFADLDPGGDGIPEGADFVEFDGHLYFEGDNGIDGNELFRTDGISAPVQFLDLAPGASSGTPKALAATASRLFFVGSDDEDDYLWRSDGTLPATAPGTEKVFESNVSDLTVMGDAVYLPRDDGSSGEELWRVDSTTAVRVVDLWPGTDGSDPEVLGVINDRVVFRAEDGTEDGLFRLWSTDGTVDDLLFLGALGSNVYGSDIVALTDHLYFAAEVAGEGVELWRTDGTSLEMIDLEPGPASSDPSKLTGGGDRLFFLAYDSAAKKDLHLLVEERFLFSDGFESGDTTSWQ